jgi:hypothetical protein
VTANAFVKNTVSRASPLAFFEGKGVGQSWFGFLKLGLVSREVLQWEVGKN